VDRYFGRFHPSRRDRWVFGDRDSGAFLIKFAWTGNVRHQLVKGGASPDDPALAEYWQNSRRRKAPLPMDKTSLLLAVRQQGLCPPTSTTTPSSPWTGCPTPASSARRANQRILILSILTPPG